VNSACQGRVDQTDSVPSHVDDKVHYFKFVEQCIRGEKNIYKIQIVLSQRLALCIFYSELDCNEVVFYLHYSPSSSSSAGDG
jgi:hypothetical protein